MEVHGERVSGAAQEAATVSFAPVASPRALGGADGPRNCSASQCAAGRSATATEDGEGKRGGGAGPARSVTTTEGSSTGDAAGSPAGSRAAVGCRARCMLVLHGAVPVSAGPGRQGGRSRGLLLPPLPHGLCVGGQKGGGGGEGEGEGEEAFGGTRGSCGGAGTCASLVGAGEEEEADASDLLLPLSYPCSSSTTAVACSWLVILVFCFAWSVWTRTPVFFALIVDNGICMYMAGLAGCSSRCVPCCCLQARDALHHDRYGQEGHFCAIFRQLHVQRWAPRAVFFPFVRPKMLRRPVRTSRTVARGLWFTLQKTVESPQLQFIAGHRHPVHAAEAGPDYSADHSDSLVAVRFQVVDVLFMRVVQILRCCRGDVLGAPTDAAR